VALQSPQRVEALSNRSSKDLLRQIRLSRYQEPLQCRGAGPVQARSVQRYADGPQRKSTRTITTSHNRLGFSSFHFLPACLSVVEHCIPTCVQNESISDASIISVNSWARSRLVSHFTLNPKMAMLAANVIDAEGARLHGM
jgi:hypothetical protein